MPLNELPGLVSLNLLMGQGNFELSFNTLLSKIFYIFLLLQPVTNKKNERKHDSIIKGKLRFDKIPKKGSLK